MLWDCSKAFPLLPASRQPFRAKEGEENLDTKQMIGARIRAIRKRRGLTQEALSELIDINPKYLSSIERGKENPTLNTLITLANAMEVDLGEIFSVLQAEDPAATREMVLELIDNADDEQLNLFFRILLVIVR